MFLPIRINCCTLRVRAATMCDSNISAASSKITGKTEICQLILTERERERDLIKCPYQPTDWCL